jgi:subtilisin family serine protease
VISVAAVFDDGRLAPFSNYGESVDLAAPGVAIESTVPDNHHLQLSGTSQAAPHVAGTAAAVKAINPALNASDLKKIILGTVDVKAELKGKVKTSGVLNNARALEAARLSLDNSVEQAITLAKENVSNALTEEYYTLRAPAQTGLLLDVQPHLLGN